MTISFLGADPPVDPSFLYTTFMVGWVCCDGWQPQRTSTLGLAMASPARGATGARGGLEKAAGTGNCKNAFLVGRRPELRLVSQGRAGQDEGVTRLKASKDRSAGVRVSAVLPGGQSEGLAVERGDTVPFGT
ncbi:hypothetical protein GKC28_04835 [Leisingera sp. ANG59]|nr:hypothetical protein [Leisingera sp. ANG59]